MASCCAHCDNYVFWVNNTTGCGQNQDLTDVLDAELQGEPLWRRHARSNSSSALNYSNDKLGFLCVTRDFEMAQERACVKCT